MTVAELLPIPGSAGRASENFKRWGLSGDLQLWSAIPRLGRLTLYGEVMLTSNMDRGVAIADPVALGRAQRSLGGYAALTQELTELATIGVRYDHYVPNLDVLEPYDGTTVATRREFQTVSAGASLNFRQGERVRSRLLFEYQHQRNELGRDASGRPDHLDNDTFRVRAELAF